MNYRLESGLGSRLARALAAIGLALALGAAATAAQAQSSVIRFGVPPWPGVTVKSEVASQLLETLGYDTKQMQLSVPFILNALTTGDMEVYLGGWYPVEAAMIDPLVESGKAIKLTANISDALTGLAVPTYVHKAGVDSVDDLSRYADRFDSTIYGIEPGSSWNNKMSQTIEAGRHDLGDWELVQSSTSAMLAQVGRATSQENWIAFFGWKPHWMNVTYDLYYLKAPKDSEIADMKSTVYTVVPGEFPEKRPNLARFFKQYQVDSKIQSDWIYAYSYKQQPADKVAREWISTHMDVVRKWLKGVTTADGEPAFQAVKEAYGG